MNIAKEEGLVKKFKLTTTIGTYKGSWFHVYHHRNNWGCWQHYTEDHRIANPPLDSLVQATRGKTTKSFYTMPEYEEWRTNLGASASSWTIKYYKVWLSLLVPLVFVSLICCLCLLLWFSFACSCQFLVQGLGTSTAQEGREYFKAITDHKKDFVWEDDQDGNHIELAFSKKGIADRKQWLTNFQVSSCIFPQFGMVCLCWINTKSANWFSAWNVYWPTREKSQV